MSQPSEKTLLGKRTVGHTCRYKVPSSYGTRQWYDCLLEYSGTVTSFASQTHSSSANTKVSHKVEGEDNSVAMWKFIPQPFLGPPRILPFDSGLGKMIPGHLHFSLALSLLHFPGPHSRWRWDYHPWWGLCACCVSPSGGPAPPPELSLTWNLASYNIIVLEWKKFT